MTKFTFNKLAIAVSLIVVSAGAQATNPTTADAIANGVIAPITTGIGYTSKFVIKKTMVSSETLLGKKVGQTLTIKTGDAFNSGVFPTVASMAWNDIAVDPDATEKACNATLDGTAGGTPIYASATVAATDATHAKTPSPVAGTTISTTCLLYPLDMNTNTSATGLFNTGLDTGGWAMTGKWHLIDLSALAGGRYNVTVTVENDATPATAPTATAAQTVNKLGVVVTPSPTTVALDDLIPALTVFDGYQNIGVTGNFHWISNKHLADANPWSDMLIPEKNLVGLVTAGKGYDTAFAGASSTHKAQVSGVISLSGSTAVANKGNRYLSVFVGGDNRDPIQKGAKQYKISVQVTKK